MHHNIKYFVLSQEPTAEQYALSFQTPETVPQSKDGTKWLLKCSCEGLPTEFSGEGVELFDHDEFLRYAGTSAWS